MANNSLPKPNITIFNYLNLAHGDYLVSRHLLVHGFLEHGAMLASTAVEKYLKAVIGVHGITKSEHLGKALYQLIHTSQPTLYEQLDMDFIKFLEKTFKLRYAKVSSPGLAIVINQYRTLIALDSTIKQIDAGFLLRKNEDILDTPYRIDVKNKNHELLTDNIALNNKISSYLFKRTNKVLELKIEHNLTTIAASYETEGVNWIGSFLKIPELSLNKNEFALIKG